MFRGRKEMKVIIAAAGTGGHINPGIAIANKIMKEEPNSKIVFVGTNRGIEKDLVPRAGYQLETIEAYGFSKKISREHIRRTLKTIESYGKAEKIVKKFKPDIVIGTGGYICGPVLTAAQKLKIPTMLHESNSFPGLAVKMLARKTNTILLGFKEAKEFLPKSAHVVVTGTPTKIEPLHWTEEEKRKEKENFGLEADLPTVLVFGGSQGAKKINDTMIDLIKNHADKGYQVIWAVGQKNFEEVQKVFQKDQLDVEHLQHAKVVPYIYHMERVMNMADILVCRSGAITIAEICKLGKPAIFVPLPNVSQNHQEKNARVLQKMGAAYIILNQELTKEKLADTIQTMIQDPKKMKSMGENAEKLAIHQVEDKIYQEIKKLVK